MATKEKEVSSESATAEMLNWEARVKSELEIAAQWVSNLLFDMYT